MAKKKNGTNKGEPQTSAETEQTYTNAMDKIRDEMAKSKSDQIQLLGEGLTALIQLHPEWEKHILEKGKTLDGALDAVRKNATGGCSDPIRTTKSLCEYYGFPCKDHRRLGMEVTAALMGGTQDVIKPAQDAIKPAQDVIKPAQDAIKPETPAADPFDLDALLGGL